MRTPILTDRRRLMLGLTALTLLPALSARAATFASRRISVTVRGNGPDVFLIPGLASGTSIWAGAIAAVPGYRYHLVQLRGFAGVAPDLNKSGPLIDPVAREIQRYIRTMGLRDPAIVGHSMGGTLAMMLALRGLSRRIMVVDMLPDGAGIVGGSGTGMGFLADQLSQFFTATPGGRKMFADMLGSNPGAQGSDPDVVATALRELAHIDLTPQLAALPPGMTVVYAQSADAELRKSQAQRFRLGYAGARQVKLVPIGPSGHVVMADQPTRFAAALRGFLAGYTKLH